ncbi:hypothetical protein [Robertmurraya massiliosenegalensis]|uniref:hypothetical protein n=1 Tax=Robertmurraya massiliosenegalensis TaxID=1287657 RepID=UPI0002E5A3C8|nr:hypothetical protein [Robertmurraya massiliosenegalensis]
MFTLSSIDELEEAQKRIDNIKNDYPVLYEKLLDAVYLTRALQFKYRYMGCLIMDEDAGDDTPQFVYGSVIRVYRRELKKLKEDQDFLVLKQLFTNFRDAGYSKISLLVLGMPPESLVGTSYIR